MKKPTYDKHFCPCAKYLIRTITTEEEAREFARFFFSRCIKDKIPDNIQLQVYSAAYNGNYVEQDTDLFFTYEGEKVEEDSYIDLIRADIDAAPDEFLDCREYCADRVYDGGGPSKSRICKICERFNKYDYCNALISEDYAIIKYIASSRSRLRRFMEDISVLKDKERPFRSLEDLARDIKMYDKPVVVSFFNTVYGILKISDAQGTFFTGDADKIASEDVIQESLEGLIVAVASELVEKDGAFRAFYDKHYDLFEPLYLAFVDKVMETELLSDADYDTCIDNHVSLYWNTRAKRAKRAAVVSPVVVKPAETEQLSFFDYLDAGTGTPEQTVTVKPETETEGHTEPPVELDAEEAMVDQDKSDAGSSDKGAEGIKADGSLDFGGVKADGSLDFGDTKKPTDEKDVSSYEIKITDKEVLTQENLGNTGSEKPRDPVGESAPEEAPEEPATKPEPLKADDTGNIADATIRRGVVNPRPRLAGDTGMTDDDIYVPHYPVYHNEYIEKVFQNIFRQKTPFFSSKTVVDKSDRYIYTEISIEVVYVEEKGWMLLFTTEKDKDVWYCTISDMPEGLVRLLETDKVVKLSFEPYLLYSVLRNIGVRMRRCYSLLNMNMYTGMQQRLAGVEEMERVYLHKGQSTTLLDDEGLTLATREHLINYATLYRMQQKLIKGKDKDKIYQQLLRDEVLGYSYMRETFLSDESVLFIRGERGLVFNNSFVHSAIVSGYFITYYIKTDDMSNAKKHRLYLYLLTELLNKGLSRKYDFYIVTLSNGTMTLFVPKNSYTVVTEMIHERMDMFAMDSGISKYELNVVEEYTDPVGAEDDEKRFERARRYNDRLNELAALRTANQFIDRNQLDLKNKVEVKATRIKIANPENKRIEMMKTRQKQNGDS